MLFSTDPNVFDSQFTSKLLNASKYTKYLSKDVLLFGLTSNMFRRNESTFYIKTDRIIDVVFFSIWCSTEEDMNARKLN